MFKIALRSLGAHKIRLLLTAAAVFLGVAFVTGMLMLTNALDRTFTDIFESSAQDVLVARTAAVAEDITQSTGDDQVQLISQKTVDEIRGVEGVRAADGGIFQNGAYLLDAEGEATAHYAGELLKARGLRVTRIARGLPAGGELEHVDGMTIAQALLDRRAV